MEMTLSEEVVFELIEGKGTKIATVDFIKVDGSPRKANGLFKPSSHIVGSDRGYQQGEMMRQKGLVPFYDLQKKHWISFYANRVVDIK
ncbi:WYL domain containing protein [uncultured Caudovirales phage]|uniref:WYL domain containing protein n=1 Tax=uncultured Caudovirales phage TaxID=2100421 RepID=A0A6J5KUK0_9CAUD|nr:WYL domain containing protein [uncultured Caudovirales phage]CAB5220981.1 WYL domain containing protein [uncultured Caudovirales phage]